MRVDVAGPDDWARMRDLRLAALADAPDAFGSTLQDEAAFPEQKWHERVENPDVGTFAVVVDDRDAGLAVAAPAGGGDVGLYSVWVAPWARGRGAGVALVEAAVAWARSRGYARMVLDVADDAVAAIALYARTGFEPTGRTSTLPPPRTHITEHERARALGDYST